MDHEEKLARIAELKDELRQLETELVQEAPPEHWRPTSYYAAYYATTGFLLGSFGATTSLLANVVGSLVWSGVRGEPQNPLKLIQVYLTFPLGAAALKIDTGITLAIGCCLYLGTGMLYGMAFQLFLTRYAPEASLSRRLAICSVLALIIWAVNFYGILSWLQPLLFGGDWIVELVPWWVAALTHLVFGWTMAIVYPLGLFYPFKPQTEKS
jgi:hypothetical protein